MSDTQNRLDLGAKTLMGLIKRAEDGAAEMCEACDFEASAKLHRVAAYMRLAYAEGRTLNVGGIQPRGGGK